MHAPRFSFGVVCASQALLLAALSFTARAQAQSAEEPLPPSPPPPINVPVPAPAPLAWPAQPLAFVQLDAGQRSFSVLTPESEQLVADCHSACGFWAWPGKYQVRIRSAEGGKEATVSVRIRESSSYRFVPADRAARNTGLVLGIAGSTVGLVGMAFTMVGLLIPCSDLATDRSCDASPALYAGLAGLVVGAGVGTAGWISFVNNRAHFQPTLTPLPRGGLRLGASFAF